MSVVVEAERAQEAAAATRSSTVILCAWRGLLAETAECMLQLRDRGWGYVIKRGDALITRSRSIAVSDWYRRTDDDVFLMIDDDVVFLPEHAERVVELARRTRSVACAAYPVKDGSHLACRRFPGQEIVFGPGSESVEVIYAATGFMAVHRDVITAMIEARTPEGGPHFPLCGVGGLTPMWPFFDTFVLSSPDGQNEYLSEDYAFSEVARRLGFKVWLDPSVILYHMGYYPYTIENMTAGIRKIEPAEASPLGTRYGFRMLVQPGDEVVGRDIQAQGAWDIEATEALAPLIRPGDTFLDVGAHIGWFSMVAASRGARVIAVEPVPEHAALVRKNAEINGYAVDVRVRAAVGAGGSRAMVLDARNPGGASTTDGPGDIVVAGATLPAMLGETLPDVIKLDIEGDEFEALSAPGMDRMLRHARVVLCERRPGAADPLGLLRAAGFSLACVNQRGTYEDWLGVRE